MIDVVRTSWSALREVSAPAGNSLSVCTLPTGRTDALYLGLDAAGHEHLLVRAAGPAFDLHAFNSSALVFRERYLELRGGSQRFLDIECSLDAAQEIFDHFIVAVGERIEKSQDALEVSVAQVLQAWRDFLTPADTPLAANGLRGLFAELLVLRDLALIDPHRAVGAWTGPYEARHDFRINNRAIEVKSTSAHTAKTVTIHGVDQLLAPEGGTLLLHLVRLERVPEGTDSVQSLVEVLLQLGCPPVDVFRGLKKSGVPALSLDETSKYPISVLERITYEVTPDSPRIVPASFVGAGQPRGVVDLNYRLDLTHFEPNQTTEPATISQLQAVMKP